MSKLILHSSSGAKTQVQADEFLGTATSATKWATPRILSISGSITGSATIDGSGNIDISTSTNHNHDGKYSWYTQFNTSDTNVPASYGAIWSQYGNRTGQAVGDTYYVATSSNHDLFSGVQVNNATTITWTRMLNEKNYSSYALSLSGGSMNGAISFANNGNSAPPESTPTALSYGRLQSYGNLYLNANTDNSGDEYILLTAGKGVSSNLADGLAIWPEQMTWLSKWGFSATSIQHIQSGSYFDMITFIEGETYGCGIQIGAGGSVAIGAGESAGFIRAGISGSDENLRLGADGSIYFYSNCDTQTTDYKLMTFNASGDLLIPRYVQSHGASGLYTMIGSQNSAYSHFQTNAPAFYFNKTTYIDGDLYGYGGTRNIYNYNLQGNATYATTAGWADPRGQSFNIDASGLDQSTYYPVVISGHATGVNRRVILNNALNSNVPSWSTHGSGFSCQIDVLVTGSGWGTVEGTYILLSDNYRFANVKPAYFGGQILETSETIFYVRGGGIYYFYTDFIANGTLHTSRYTPYSEYPDIYVEPTTGTPGIKRVGQGSIGANVDSVDGQHFYWTNDDNHLTYLWGVTTSGTTKLIDRGAMHVGYSVESNTANQLRGGFPPSVDMVGATCVIRDGNGYIYVNYINSNTSNNENPSVSQIIVTNGSDNYYRKASLSHVMSSQFGWTKQSVYFTSGEADVACSGVTTSSTVIATLNPTEGGGNDPQCIGFCVSNGYVHLANVVGSTLGTRYRNASIFWTK